MSALVAVDPGLRACGAALYVDGALCAAAYVASHSTAKGAPAWHAMAHAVHNRVWQDWKVYPNRFLVEHMQVYTGQPVPSADLLDVQSVSAMLCNMFWSQCEGAVQAVLPATWKGQVPKHIHHARVLKELSPAETVVLQKGFLGVRKDLQHNVLDAVALGLYGVGRRV